MNSDISAFLEPLYEHLETVSCKLVSQPGRLDVVMAEVRCCVVFSLPTPEDDIEQSSANARSRRTLTVGLSGVRATDVVDPR